MTAVLKIKGDRYYAVLNYKEGTEYKQKWISLGLPVKNNKRKAEGMLDEIKREYADGYETPAGDMMFTAYIKQWLIKKKPCVELSTWEGYQIYAERHIIPYFEPLRLSLRDLKPKHIQEYYQYKYTSGRLDNKPGGLSIPSIKKHSIVIKEVLDDAVLAELIVRNPANGIKMPAKNISTREKTFLTADKANLLLKAFEGHPLQALVYVTLYYGLRRSEVLGLRWSAIDFDRNTLSINHTVVKNRTIVKKDTVKSQTSFHTYLLIDDVKDVLLQEYRKKKENAQKFSSAYKNTDYVFTWEDGTLFRPDYITRGFQRVLKHNGLPMMRFHDLRHSTASILYDKGWDIKDIQSWLRHSSIDVTSDIYTHITEDRKSRMATELNSTFKI
ncbi:MAG: site-specific integrase [Clostridia bacterium]|nr:site-specific integrase [Clostridia bacterium]